MPTTPTSNRRPIVILAISFILALVLGLSIFLMVLPTLLSSSWGNARLLNGVNVRIPGRISAQKIELSWLGNQTIKGGKLTDPDGKFVGNFDTFTTQTSLFRLLWSLGSQVDAQVNGLNLRLFLDKTGSSNLQRALGLEPFSGLNESPKPTAIALSDVQGKFLIRSFEEPIALQVKGYTQQDGFSGNFALEAILDGFDAQSVRKLSANISHFPMDLAEQLISLKNPQAGHFLRAALGKTLDATLEQVKTPQGMRLDLQASSPNFNAQLSGHLNEGGFALLSPGQIALTVTPQLSEFLFGKTSLVTPPSIQLTLEKLSLPFTADSGKIEIALQSTTSIELNELAGIGSVALHDIRLNVEGNSWDQPQFSLQAALKPTVASTLLSPSQLHLKAGPFKRGLDLATLHAKGSLWVDNLSFGERNTSKTASIRDVEIPWEIDALNNKITLALKGNTSLNAGITGKAEIVNWLQEGAISFDKASYKANAALSSMPVALLEAIFNKPGLTELLGSSIDLDFSSGSADLLSIVLRSENLEGNADLQLGQVIRLNKPANLNLTLTPQRFQALRKLISNNASQDKFALQQDAHINATIDQFHFTTERSLSKAKMNGTISIDKLAVLDQITNQYMGFEDLKGQIKSDHLGEAIDFDLRALQRDRAGNSSNLTFSGKVQDAFLPNGSLNTRDLSLTLLAQAKRLPAGMLCEVACLEKTSRLKVEALFGPFVDGEVMVTLRRMSGPVKAHISGQLGQASLDAQINQGIMTLNAPFQAEFTASPELGSSVLQDIVPLLGGMQRSNERLRIAIAKEDFSLPLKASSIANIQVGQMAIELGQVEFSNEGQLSKILSIFKADSSDAIQVWFTPIYVSMRHGVIQLERFDMLAMQRYPIAAWGTVDIPDDDIEMVIGLSGRSLQNALGMPIPDSHYVMQFPLRGPIGKATVDKKVATAKIAAIAAALTGPQGMLVGAVIGLASGAFTEEKTPPPTTNPLPWDNGQKNEEQAERPRTKNPLKALEKGVL